MVVSSLTVALAVLDPLFTGILFVLWRNWFIQIVMVIMMPLFTVDLF